jgi:phage terminase large subunit
VTPVLKRAARAEHMEAVKARMAQEDAIDQQVQLFTTPAGFCEGMLGLQPYEWQREVLSWFTDIWGRQKGVCAAPNGAGKSANIIGPLALFWLCMAPRATIVITSADSRQIDHQIWPAIIKHRDKFPTFKFQERHIVSPTGGEIVAFTTDEPGRAEGWHFEKPDKPLLMIADEAKSIRQDIFTAIDRCTFNALLLISSTGRNSGEFYRAMRGMIPGYKTRKVSLKECPHVDPQKIYDLEAKYGPKHPFVQSVFHSEFISEDDENRYFFTKERVDQLVQHPPAYKSGTGRIFYCDFAGGAAENVIAMRRGNRITICKAWHEANEMVAVGQFIREFRKLEAKAEEIYGDDCGPGKPMINRMHEAGWPIHRINGNATAMRATEYGNRSAEIWDSAAMAVEQAEVSIPDDDILIPQLCSRQRATDSKGRMLCEGKQDMRKRGIESPDRADAVVAVIALGRNWFYRQNSHLVTPIAGTFQDANGDNIEAWNEFEEEGPSYYVIGSHAG